MVDPQDRADSGAALLIAKLTAHDILHCTKCQDVALAAQYVPVFRGLPLNGLAIALA
jgi:hypothetical protein